MKQSAIIPQINMTDYEFYSNILVLNVLMLYICASAYP